MSDSKVAEPIARIRALLKAMEAQTAEAREEMLTATEQLLTQARAHHEEALASRRRTEKSVNRSLRRRRHRT